MEGWKRRAQARAAKGNLAEAISDLTQAISLSANDADSFHQRALVYYRQKNYLMAIEDLNASLVMDSKIASSWNQLGLALTAVGRPWDVCDCFYLNFVFDWLMIVNKQIKKRLFIQRIIHIIVYSYSIMSLLFTYALIIFAVIII